ncbi:MAG: 2TM domain-containing protein [Chloroflexota bacterium]|nr:2TM domain-containing protein [Chloroflexota bacterium]
MSRRDGMIKRIKQWWVELAGLYRHFAVYMVVIILMVLIDGITGGSWWFYWAAIGWGVALVMHSISVLSTGWEDRKLKEALEKEKEKEKEKEITREK